MNHRLESETVIVHNRFFDLGFEQVEPSVDLGDEPPLDSAGSARIYPPGLIQAEVGPAMMMRFWNLSCAYHIFQ